MVAPLRRVVVKSPRAAFGSIEAIAAQWEPLGYLGPPDIEKADAAHQQFVALLENGGAEVLHLPEAPGTGLDSLYVRDPVLVTDAGAVLLRMGKVARRGEVAPYRAALDAWGLPILGELTGEATAEAGDMVWLDPETLLVGRGFRTNTAGIGQLTDLLAPLGVQVQAFHLPYEHGPGEVLHLMSFLSPVDEDLAVVYRRLMPVPLYELLSERGIELVDVPDAEYRTMASNVFALGPRRVVMVAGNPVTRARLEAAGCRVSEIDGSELCVPGAGGPTCLTRPLVRG
jgi:N-dimethylarginine dimethylaminohydrolase